jgi:Ca2+-binding RTX toxin-like protein
MSARAGSADGGVAVAISFMLVLFMPSKSEATHLMCENVATTPGGDGTSSADNIGGGAGNDVIQALAGNDDVHGDDDKDRVCGGLDNDTVRGNDHVDEVYGGGGNDEVHGGPEGVRQLGTGTRERP